MLPVVEADPTVPSKHPIVNRLNSLTELIKTYCHISSRHSWPQMYFLKSQYQKTVTCSVARITATFTEPVFFMLNSQLLVVPFNEKLQEIIKEFENLVNNILPALYYGFCKGLAELLETIYNNIPLCS